jgi:hypothetical protein
MIASDLSWMHGPYTGDFSISELDVWVAPFSNPAAEHFVGRTEAEKTFSPKLTWEIWKTGMPKVPYIMAVSEVDISMKFSFKQVGDITLDGLAWNLEIDFTNPGSDIGYFGSKPPAPLECRWRFVLDLYDGRYWQLVFRRAVVMNAEDFVTGNGSWASLPITITALMDESICDKQRDMAFICIEPLSTPSGGFIDPCPNVVPACDPD